MLSRQLLELALERLARDGNRLAAFDTFDEKRLESFLRRSSLVTPEKVANVLADGSVATGSSLLGECTQFSGQR